MKTSLFDPSSDLVRNLTSYAGREGRRWLNDLPERVEELSSRWQLADVEPFTDLSFNFVAHSVRAGRRVVLKIGWEDQAIRRESNWLIHYGRHTTDLVVPVLACDGEDAYLMPRLEPGTSLNQHSDEVATEIIGNCIHALTETPSGTPEEPYYPTIGDWFGLLTRASEASRRTLGNRIDRALSLAGELLQNSEERLLHGDLHHANVLKDDDRWIVTDPHGVIGDPTLECAAMLRNALGSIKSAIRTGVYRRVDQLADTTGFDAARVAAWGYAQNVLSCVWSLDADPNADVTAAVAVVDALESR